MGVGKQLQAAKNLTRKESTYSFHGVSDEEGVGFDEDDDDG